MLSNNTPRHQLTFKLIENTQLTEAILDRFTNNTHNMPKNQPDRNSTQEIFPRKVHQVFKIGSKVRGSQVAANVNIF